ncbi:MAG: DUF6273 domain-containing protein, partial [Clostridiales Family XIII bacterium]|nr:DUF6273 domain-containing protein [Clostridiales Family XIII bacterium]
QTDLGKDGEADVPEGEEGVDWVIHEAIYDNVDDVDSPINDGNHYYQIEPIAWQVLENNNGELFLLARDCLDRENYNETRIGITWGTCTLRSWLNGYDESFNTDNIDYSSENFLANAFITGEQDAINTTTNQNYTSSSDYVSDGTTTDDKVFLLSVPESKSYGFNLSLAVYDSARRAKPTDYAIAKGTRISTNETYYGNSMWWLRSPAKNTEAADKAAVISNNGYVSQNGYGVNNTFTSVRPALKINLTSVIFVSEDSETFIITKIPTITTTSLSNGKVGTAYSQPLVAKSITPVTWSVTGNLPNGLALDPSVGVISGTPTVAGTFTFTIQADNDGPTPATQALSITIAALPPPPQYTVIINNGTGGGSYVKNTTVSITANAPEDGKVFDTWTTSDVTLADPNSSTTSFTMPDKAVTVTATYKADPKDSDGDGVPDYVEIEEGTDPNDATSFKDTDGDGVPDYVEEQDGTDPTDKNSFKDVNGDGIPDYNEDPTHPQNNPPKADGWVYENGAWKFFIDGEAKIGWLYDDGAWYYTNKDGIMQTGWIYDHNTWYYLAGNGKMKTGWVKDDGNWYYLSGNGAMVWSKWFHDTDGSWYYLSGNGKMLTGKQRIGGKVYSFKGNGVWVG